jgi:hypothetical protein
MAIDDVRHDSSNGKLDTEIDHAETDHNGDGPRFARICGLTPGKESNSGQKQVGRHDGKSEFGLYNCVNAFDVSRDCRQDFLPKTPLFAFESLLTVPSSKGPAISIPRTDATKAERLQAPTALIEKLYGGAENICERVIEMPTSQDMLVVNSSVPHATAGESNMVNGRTKCADQLISLLWPE